MELAKAGNNPTITSDCPIPNMYNSLSERPVETEIPDMCVNDMLRENSHPVVITTVRAEKSLLSGQLIKSESRDLSENRNIHDPTEHSGLNKEDEKPYLIENHRNLIPQVNDMIIESMPARTASEDNRFVCDLCDKKFSKSSNLVRHKKSHAGGRFFVCDICGKQISSSSDLAMHKRTHTGEKRFVCSICDKRFTSSSDLIKHRRVHTGERPFACDTCEKRFTSSSDLTKHKRIHTGEKPFVCNFCDRRFARSSDLTKHRRTHTGEKPFVCNFCNKRFSCSNGLIQHKRSHAVENLISGLLLPVTPEGI